MSRHKELSKHKPRQQLKNLLKLCTHFTQGHWLMSRHKELSKHKPRQQLKNLLKLCTHFTLFLADKLLFERPLSNMMYLNRQLNPSAALFCIFN